MGVGLFITGVTGLAATLSIIYHKPFLGIDGGALVDAALFALVSWRIYKMSRPWAIVGLLLYLAEVAWRIAKHVGSSDAGFSAGFTPVALVFVLAFVNAVRGTFAFHRFSKVAGISGAPFPVAKMDVQPTNQMPARLSPEVRPDLALAGGTGAKDKFAALLLFAIALLLWVATITNNTLGFVPPVNAEALGGDILVALVWILFIYASRKLYRSFWKRSSASKAQ